jgi:hypothetical protein
MRELLIYEENSTAKGVSAIEFFILSVHAQVYSSQAGVISEEEEPLDLLPSRTTRSGCIRIGLVNIPV